MTKEHKNEDNKHRMGQNVERDKTSKRKKNLDWK
jgi:hypothetical protein